MKTCPACNASSFDSVKTCECGHRFGSRTQGGVIHQGVTIRGIDLTWAETFMVCLKWAICAIPAIWIAYVAYHIPGFLINAAGTAAVVGGK